MSYYLQGLGAAFPSSGMTSAINTSAVTTKATTYFDPQMSFRPVTCSQGTVLDASGTGCVSPLRCSGGSLLNLKTGECVFPNKAAPLLAFVQRAGIKPTVAVPQDLGPVQKVSDCAAQGGILNPQTGECTLPISMPVATNVVDQPPDHTMLYVGLGVAAVAAIAIGAVMMKKKRAES